MSAERGLTLGKFLPLHLGHELLLTVAATQCRDLTVLIGTTPHDAYSFEQRETWVQDIVGHWLPRERIHVVADPDPNPNVEKDGQGTVTDESYWTAWLDQNASYLRACDCVFTSDRYGAQIARRAGIEWFPVDPDRTVSAISGSRILADPIRYFDYISDVAKPDVGLTVAVLGAESTGKSTLVKALADHYGSRFAPEWGRTISEAKPELDAADFDSILSVQSHFIQSVQRHGNGLCFTDTDAITTALFAPIYLGTEHASAWQAAAEQRFDLYLVLAPTVPWINDGTRILDHGERDQFHAALVDALKRLDKPFEVIDASDFGARHQAALRSVDALLETRARRLAGPGSR